MSGTALRDWKAGTAIEENAETEDGAADRSGLRRMLNEKQVLEIVPVSPVTLWRMEKKGLFPRGTFISPNKKIWWADEIQRWQREVDGRGRGRRQHPICSKA